MILQRRNGLSEFLRSASKPPAMRDAFLAYTVFTGLVCKLETFSCEPFPKTGLIAKQLE